jgi:hypothetical protein
MVDDAPDVAVERGSASSTRQVPHPREAAGQHLFGVVGKRDGGASANESLSYHESRQ